MNNRCANTEALNAHLAKEEADEKYTEAVEARAAELMLPGGYCHPLDADNLAEAISEVSTPFWIKLAALMSSNDAIAVDAHCRAESAAYWSKLATTKAETEIETEMREFPCCRGRGCRKCEQQNE